MGGDQGTAEVRWDLWGFFYADCPTRLISQCTLQRPATEFEIDSLLITRVLTPAVRLFAPFI